MPDDSRTPRVVAFSAQDPSVLVWLDVDRGVIVKRGLGDAAVAELHREVERLAVADAAGAVRAPAGTAVVDGAEFPHVAGITLGRAIWGSRNRARRALLGRAIASAQALDAGVAGVTHPDFSVENLIVGRSGAITLIDWKEEAVVDGCPVALSSLLGSVIAYRSTDVTARFQALVDTSPAFAGVLSERLAAAMRDRDTVVLRGISGRSRDTLAELIESQLSAVAR